MRTLLAFVLAVAAGCTAPALPIDHSRTLELDNCQAPPLELLAAVEHCPGRTDRGISCYVCRDYTACLHGREGEESAGYCVDVRLGCDDPICAF
jgi:hypothetical protein